MSRSLADAQGWVSKFDEYVHDRSRRLGRLLRKRRGELKSEVTTEWSELFEELDEMADLLEADLDYLVTRRLPAELRPDFERAKEPLSNLRLAIHNIGYDGDVDERYRQDRDWIKEREVDERSTGCLAGGRCPAPDCTAEFETAKELRSHFGKHPWYQDEDLLLHAGKHRARVLEAVGPCREIVRDLISRVEEWGGGSAEEQQARPVGSVEERQSSLDDQAPTGLGQEERYVFRQRGNYWEFAYEDEHISSFESKAGLAYIRYLLARPGISISVGELAKLSSKAPPRGPRPPQPGPQFEDPATFDGKKDDEDVKRTNKAWDEGERELTAEIDQLENRIQRLEDERADESAIQALMEQLRAKESALERLRKERGAAFAKDGRERDIADPLKRPRQAVSVAIARCIDKIRELGAPKLADHFQGSISTGTGCMYRPVEVPDWQL